MPAVYNSMCLCTSRHSSVPHRTRNRPNGSYIFPDRLRLIIVGRERWSDHNVTILHVWQGLQIDIVVSSLHDCSSLRSSFVICR